jgi:crossover junction endodeoxyribonuclease RusA
MSYCTKEAKAYKKYFTQYVKDEAAKQGWDLTPNEWQHFYIDAVFYFPRLDLDPNNHLKILLDSITDSKVIWIDDNVACERVQAIYYDAQNPRIELTIHPVDYVGIFKDEETLKEFEDKCRQCSRYSRNCSILRKAKEGRVQEETDGCVCKKYSVKGEKGHE